MLSLLLATHAQHMREMHHAGGNCYQCLCKVTGALRWYSTLQRPVTRVPLAEFSVFGVCVGSMFKAPRHVDAAVVGSGWLLAADPGASGLRPGCDSAGLPSEHDIERLGALEQRAAQGCAEAQYEVACMLLEGRGVPRDREFGVSWLKCVPPTAFCTCDAFLSRSVLILWHS